jgi:hypothetical protein
MPLIKCHECGNDVSTTAKTCPNCGATVKTQVDDKSTKMAILITGAVVLSAIMAAASCSESEKNPDPAACKTDDLQCNGDKGSIAAGIYCDDAIEKLATYSVKWTDGVLEPKFSHFRWSNQEKGEITYIGDKAQFQNGFGAMQNVVYECDMAADRRTILDVRVRQGSL